MARDWTRSKAPGGSEGLDALASQQSIAPPSQLFSERLYVRDVKKIERRVHFLAAILACEEDEPVADLWHRLRAGEVVGDQSLNIVKGFVVAQSLASVNHRNRRIANKVSMQQPTACVIRVLGVCSGCATFGCHGPENA